MNLKESLIRICARHALPCTSKATVPEPYIPFVPKKWNGTLVLAEAQNHAGAEKSYLRWLRNLSPRRRLERLYLNRDYVGVKPWDDGTLKFAVEAAFKLSANEISISNAVLWSLLNPA